MNTRILWRSVLLILLLLGVPGAWSQEPAQGTPGQSQPAQQPPAARTAGRRDPFRTIVIKRQEEIPAVLPPGIRGLVIAQLQVKGIARGVDGAWIAMVDNNTNRAYFLREKDEVWNGVVARITPDSVIFEERVTDSSGRRQAREVIKQLEEAARPRGR